MSLNKYKEFEVNSSSLKEIRSFSRDALNEIPEAKNHEENITLAISEAAQNIIKHAYNGKPSNDLMRIEIVYQNNILTVNLLDKGDPAIPANIKPRKLDDIKPGGLGTFFIGEIMDEITFKISKQDWVNHLTMTKKI